ncbi:beta-lactamase-like protein [Fennellomyces sp. T-0311]|nr:beta-lactamase-like protein [Fennellomyces sp. T-0311]
MPDIRNNLAPLPVFAQLSDRVWRVLGLNPGPFTLQGTNTYLVGSGNRKVLIDAGQGDERYVPLLQESLKLISPEAYISDVILTHCHMDHWGGLKDIYAIDDSIPVYKYPVVPGSYEDLHFMDDFPSYIPIQPLFDGQIFEVDEETTLRVIHTPGHTNDHCSFYLEEEESMFTGDCILGHGTVMFDNLIEYIDGLKKLQALRPQQLYPGHGPVVEDGMAKIQEYLEFRYQREHEILQLIQSDRNKAWTPLEIGTQLREDKGGNLQAAYLRGIALHVLKLEEDGKVEMLEQLEVQGDQKVIHMFDLIELLNKEWRYVESTRSRL